jgi:hypothetical protein
MLKSGEMMKRRLREGVEFFRFLAGGRTGSETADRHR